MIKLVYCLARRADVSAEAFYAYWGREHAAKVRQRQKALRAVKYVQSHTVEPGLNQLLQQSRGLQPPHDGITEIWWESVEAAIHGPVGVDLFCEFGTEKVPGDGIQLTRS